MKSILPWLAILTVSLIGLRLLMRPLVILEYEKGLRYVRGRFTGVLGPGVYVSLPLITRIEVIDTRPRFVTIPGQEVLSADGIGLKVSIAANFEIADAALAVNGTRNFTESLYLELQLALREIIGGAEIDALLRDRGDLSARLTEVARPKAEALGLRLISASLRDVMFPGRLKETFAQTMTARKEAEAALERARGETAALRSLANAARMLDDNPNLMQLRLLQAIGQSSGNTIMLGAQPPSAVTPPPKKRAEEAAAAGKAASKPSKRGTA